MTDFWKVCQLMMVVFWVCVNGNDEHGANHYHHNHGQQVIVENPTDQQAKIGDQAVFKCRIKNLKGEPQWCIDDFCLGVNKKDALNETSLANGQHLKGRPRYRVVGDRAKGEFNLVIEPVQLQDNMFFYCMATAASETIKAVKSRKVFLTVLTYPKSLILDNPVHVSLNKPSSIRCIARQSRPPVKILFAINGQLITDESKYKTEIIETPAGQNENIDLVGAGLEQHLQNMKKRYSTVASIFSISAENLRNSYYDTVTNLTVDDITMNMQGQLVECFAYSFLTPTSQNVIQHHHTNNNNNKLNINLFQNNVMNTKSNIQVDYAPEVNLKIISANRILKEEDVISLICETKATPPIQSYKWYIGKNLLNGVKDSNLNLKLRREMHLKTITCEASNTVASVKASLQLNILFKPSFVRGPKSYMQIDKSACNRPLTLDCQVNSNPHANITWYRRRLSRSYVDKLDKLRSNSAQLKAEKSNFDYTLFSSLGSKLYTFNNNFNDDANDFYEDELIGTGPTYSIASFNCANLLDNVRNRTRMTSQKSSYKASSSSREKPYKINRRFEREKPADQNAKTNQELIVNDDSYPEDVEYVEKQTSSSDYEPDYYYDYDESIGENGATNDFDTEKQDSITGESSDFGVYICEARNRFESSSSLIYNYDNQVVRRYIKLNPVGPPILRVMPSSVNSLSLDETMTLMMKISASEMSNAPSVKSAIPLIEVATSIGSSVTLTCLIEPLPRLESTLWIKDNGKIIPNSRYSINDNEAGKKTEEDDVADLKVSVGGKVKHMRNFRVKNENLTVFGKTLADDGLQDDSDFLTNNGIGSKFGRFDNMQGIITTDGHSVGLMRSLLLIKNIRKQDFGIYKCKSSNGYGSRMALVLVREKTLMDKINMNSYVSFIFLISSILIMFSLLVLLLMCVISKRTRAKICCCCLCCFSPYAGKSLKDKKLLSQNLHCELNSDKTINEWLASSKISNDTGNGSLINAPGSSNNSSSAATATTVLNAGLVLDSSASPSNVNSASSKTSKASHQTLTHSPNNLRNDLTVNCSSLLNDDDDEEDDNNQADNDLNDENKLKENEEELRLTSYQSAQFNRYLVSSPLISNSNVLTSQIISVKKDYDESNDNNLKSELEPDENDVNERDGLNPGRHHQEDQDDDGSEDEQTVHNNEHQRNDAEQNQTIIDEDETNNQHQQRMNLLKKSSPPSKSTSSTYNASIVKSHNFSNGNFNAKITSTSTNSTKAIVSTPSLNEINDSNGRYVPNSALNNFRNKMNAQNYPNHYYQQQQQQHHHTPAHYANNTNNHHHHHLSHTLNRLNNEPTRKDVNEFKSVFEDATCRLSDLFNELSPNLIVNNRFPATNMDNGQNTPNNLFNASSSSNLTGIVKSPNKHQHHHHHQNANALLQAIYANNNNSSASNLNKFPNPPPFSANTLNSTTKASQKFYNNFYRTPTLIINKNDPQFQLHQMPQINNNHNNHHHVQFQQQQQSQQPNQFKPHTLCKHLNI